MSVVKNKKIYNDLCSFSVHTIVNGKSVIKELGHYDPNSMVRCRDPRYKEGLGHTHSIYLDEYKWGTWTAHPWDGGLRIHDDHYLNRKPCIFVFFRHYPFGNNYLSKKLTKGHWHTNCIVSPNDTSIRDCMRIDTYKNIFFTGKLREDMPIVDVSGAHSLFVIEGKEL